MKVPHILFMLLLAMCVVVGIVCLIEEVPFEVIPGETEGDPPTKVYQGHGVDHPVFPSMKHGGSGAERTSRILWLGWAFGVLEVSFFVACLALGTAKGEKVGPYRKPLIAGALVYIGVFTLLVLSYRSYLNEETHVLFLTQVRPTAWMLYGMWLFPLLFAALYTVTFNSWYFSEQDLERFRQIVAEKKAQEGMES